MEPGPEPPVLAQYPAPEWLEPAAREEWERLAPQLAAIGLLSVADLPAFAAYCTEFAIFRRAGEELATRPKARLKAQAQLIGARRKAAAEIRKWAAEFGLTPSARMRIKVAPEKPTDPLSKFLPRAGAK